MYALEFERKLIKLKSRLEDARNLVSEEPGGNDKEIAKLKKDIKTEEAKAYRNLDGWKKTLIARHPERPGSYDFINHHVSGYVELHGDRQFADDLAVVAGMGKISGQPFVIIGHVKGKNTTENMKRNFGMPHPEGYRKALRCMKLADKFRLPILTLIDTPGAYPGIGAEERQQAEAIATNLQTMGEISVPIISVVLGEGGSGGALALGVANRLIMLEHSIFGVISPEGCASILWGDASKAKQAALMLKHTAQDLLALKVIDEIIAEPRNCAHNNPEQTLKSLKQAIISNYEQLKPLSPEQLISERLEKFRHMGQFREKRPLV